MNIPAGRDREADRWSAASAAHSERVGRPWSARLAELLGDLQSLSPDDRAWRDVAWFLEGLQSLRRDVVGTAGSPLRDAVTMLADQVGEDLAYFGLPVLEARAADAVPEDRQATMAEEVAWLQRMLAHHRRLRSERGRALSDDLARRSRLEALESQILQTYERLDAILSANRTKEAPPTRGAAPVRAPGPELEEADRDAYERRDHGAREATHPVTEHPPRSESGPEPTYGHHATDNHAEREGTVSGRPPYAPRWEPLGEEQRVQPPHEEDTHAGHRPDRAG